MYVRGSSSVFSKNLFPATSVPTSLPYLVSPAPVSFVSSLSPQLIPYRIHIPMYYTFAPVVNNKLPVSSRPTWRPTSICIT